MIEPTEPPGQAEAPDDEDWPEVDDLWTKRPYASRWYPAEDEDEGLTQPEESV